MKPLIIEITFKEWVTENFHHIQDPGDGRRTRCRVWSGRRSSGEQGIGVSKDGRRRRDSPQQTPQRTRPADHVSLVLRTQRTATSQSGGVIVPGIVFFLFGIHDHAKVMDRVRYQENHYTFRGVNLGTPFQLFVYTIQNEGKLFSHTIIFVFHAKIRRLEDIFPNTGRFKKGCSPLSKEKYWSFVFRATHAFKEHLPITHWVCSHNHLREDISKSLVLNCKKGK